MRRLLVASPACDAEDGVPLRLSANNNSYRTAGMPTNGGHRPAGRLERPLPGNRLEASEGNGHFLGRAIQTLPCDRIENVRALFSSTRAKGAQT
jgi:hypothetical protein